MNNNLHLIWLVLLISFIPLTPLKAQIEETGKDLYDAEIGIGFGYGLHDYSSNLSTASLSTDEIGSQCGSFIDGTGSGIYVQGLIGYDVSSFLKAEIHLGYANRSGNLKFRCVDPAEIRLSDGSLTDALTDHVLSLDLTSFEASGIVWAKPFNLPLRFGVGGTITTNSSQNFRLHEEIVAPSNAAFVSGGQIREYGQGELLTTTGVAGTIGVFYDLPAGSTVLLRPVVTLNLPLTSELNDERLRVTSFRFGLQLVKQFTLFGYDDSTPLAPADQ